MTDTMERRTSIFARYDIDIRTSMVRLGNRRYPTVVPICPVHENGFPDDDHDRALYGGGIYIPMENGALIEIEPELVRPVTRMQLMHSMCVAAFDGSAFYVPPHLAVRNQRLLAVGHPDVHLDPDWDWFSEWFDWVARMEVPSIDGPRLTYRPIDWAIDLETRLEARRPKQ